MVHGTIMSQLADEFKQAPAKWADFFGLRADDIRRMAKRAKAKPRLMTRSRQTSATHRVQATARRRRQPVRRG